MVHLLADDRDQANFICTCRHEGLRGAHMQFQGSHFDVHAAMKHGDKGHIAVYVCSGSGTRAMVVRIVMEVRDKS